jgi:glucose/arabinose dehydrogenase
VDDPIRNPASSTALTCSNSIPDGTGQRILCQRHSQLRRRSHQSDHGELWCSTNERDRSATTLPDYITQCAGRRLLRLALVLHGRPSGPAPARQTSRAEIKVITPDVLLQPHFASLEMTFYHRQAIPCRNIRATASPPSTAPGTAPAHRLRSHPRPHANGHATGEYEDFLTGFVTPDGKVWGRPVGVPSLVTGL